MNFEDSFNEFIKLRKNCHLIHLRNKKRMIRLKGKSCHGNVLYTPPKEVFEEDTNEYKNTPSSLKKEKKVKWLIVDFLIFLNDITGIINSYINDFKEFLKNYSTKNFNNIKIFVQRIKNAITNIQKVAEDRMKFTGLLEVIYNSTVLFPTRQLDKLQ
jgi:hypothetical protein